MAAVVVSDDVVGAFARSPETARLRTLAAVELRATRPAGEAGLVARIRDADVAPAFRPAFTRFPASVLAACPRLRLVCVSGTGVEDIDAAAASPRRSAHGAEAGT